MEMRALISLIALSVALSAAPVWSQGAPAAQPGGADAAAPAAPAPQPGGSEAAAPVAPAGDVALPDLSALDAEQPADAPETAGTPEGGYTVWQIIQFGGWC